MSITPTTTRQRQVDRVVRALKEAGVWAKLDALYVLAAHDAQAARLNWKQNAFNLTAVNSPTFTVDRGYNGDGSTSYLDTGFNPTVASGLFALNDESHFVWVDPAVPIGTGGNWIANTNTRIGRGATTVNSRSNQTDPGPTYSTSTFTEFFAASRAVSTGYSLYRNGGKLADYTQTAQAMANETFNIGRGAGFYSPARFNAAGYGKGLTGTEIAALHGALSSYLGAVGAA